MAGVLNQSMTCDGNTHAITTGDIVRCVVIIVIMILIIFGNVCCLIVFNSPKTKRLFVKRVRYMMNSLCCTDLGIGILMCPSTIYPALKHCWPFGEAMCKIEALLISALFHESTLNMVLIAIDRFSIIHFPRYHTHMTSRRFIVVIMCTWISVFTCYAIVIFAGEQFYFDEIGINCEPYYENAKVTLSVISIFYFIPAIIIVICYLSIYRTAIKRKVLTISPDDQVGRMVNANIRTTKYLAAITVGFFIAVSPWTLCMLIMVGANIKLQHDVDFMVTWLALSNSFWNCMIYSVMNRKFRSAAISFTFGRWAKSFKDIVSSKSKEDNSKDYSEGSSALKIRITKLTNLRSKTNSAIDNACTPFVTPNNTVTVAEKAIGVKKYEI